MKIKNKVSAKLLGSTVLSAVILLGSCQKEQEILPDAQVNKQELNLNDSITKLEAHTSVPEGFYDLTKALPLGYVKDGSKDYTVYIQKAIDNYSKIAFPSFPLLVNDAGLKVPSNRYMTFLEGSEIRLKPSSKGNYDIFRIENVSNVTFANPVIKGDRYKHLGSTGEWGNGIGVYGAYNINISGAKISECWGDGIYISGSSKKRYSEKIRVFMPRLTYNRRDGISIISVVGLEMYRPYTAFSNGTAPFCGINIEPNYSTDELQNIRIIRPVTEQNKGNGIQAGFGRIYGGGDKNISIYVEDHTDIGSSTGLLTTAYTHKKAGSEKLIGQFTVNGANWQKNTIKALNVYFEEPYLKFSLSKPKVMTLTGSYLPDHQAKTLLEGTRVIWKPTVYNLTF